MRIAILAAVLLAAGCLPAEIRRDFEHRLEMIEKADATLETEKLALGERLTAGELTAEDYAAAIAELDSRQAATRAELQRVEETFREVKAEAIEAAIEATAAKVKTGAEIVETGAPTLGKIAGTFWPFAIFLGDLVGKLAGGVAAAAAALGKKGGS